MGWDQFGRSGRAYTQGRFRGLDLFEYLDYAYGLGLRVMINKKSRANLALDMAWGKYGASGFYLGINEVF